MRCTLRASQTLAAEVLRIWCSLSVLAKGTTKFQDIFQLVLHISVWFFTCSSITDFNLCTQTKREVMKAIICYMEFCSFWVAQLQD